jgi:hypothetical protein
MMAPFLVGQLSNTNLSVDPIAAFKKLKNKGRKGKKPQAAPVTLT